MEKKIVEYAYDLHVIVYITFLRLSFAFDEVFKECSVQTMNRVKMAFLNLYKNLCLKSRTMDRYEH